ncbi:hypothetical protein [Nocardia sputorum]|uniref:Uncharacterized protein n=2 Tax=Nocardia sputorum TaxID=2984338 RepID=A0ABN6U9C3_9NOCA|nr:hypothetical protein [Nocardia sputorum]BDT94937.1 hypothetical protein IFM12275_49130 [Nocardia sputorum]BDU01812.1 hypothetical protein IFM12276_48400 [Nocardia sputorum]
MVRIGVTGHTNVTPTTEPLVYTAIGAVLAPYAAAELVGVSCLARGADSVFAKAVLAAGGRLEVVLPSRNYRAAQVRPDHAGLFDELVERATAVRVMDFDEAGSEAYEAANEAMLASCDRLIAVWDGAAGQRGGTGSVVALARQRNVPVEIVWPDGAARG